MVDRIVNIVPSKTPNNNDNVKDHVHDLNIESISEIISNLFNGSSKNAIEWINNNSISDIPNLSLSELKQKYWIFFYSILFILFIYITWQIFITRERWRFYNKQKEFHNKKRAE